MHVLSCVLLSCVVDEFFRNIASLVLLILIAILISNPALAQDGYQEIDRVVASINGEAVTASEVNKRGGGDIKSLLLEDVLEKEAEQRGLAVKDEDVDAYIEEIKKQNGLTEQDFQEVLKQRNLSQADYRIQVKKEIMRGKVMSQIIRGKINIVDEDIQRYLKAHPELQPSVGTYRINLIKGNKDQLELLRGQALKLGTSLKDLNIPGFEDLGYVALEDLREDYQKVIKSYSVGEVSEVAQLSDCYVIFEILAHVEKEGEIDAALKAEIKDAIFKEKYQEEIKKLLGDDLFKKHHLEIIK